MDKTPAPPLDAPESPVDALCRDLRRQYGAAAAGSTLLLPPLVVSDRYYSDESPPDQDVTLIEDQDVVIWDAWNRGNANDVYASASDDEQWARAAATPTTPFSEGQPCHHTSGNSFGDDFGETFAPSSTMVATATTPTTFESPLAVARRLSISRGISDSSSHYGGGRRTTRPSPMARRTTSFDLLNKLPSTPSPRPSLRRTNTTGTSTQTVLPSLEEPAHVRHFLQDTPQLRFLKPASMDMNASRHTPATAKLQRLFHPDTDSQVALSAAKEYRETVVRHKKAARDLSNLLWTLSHEMSLEDYGAVESSVFSRVFALVHQQPGDVLDDPAQRSRRMAGLSALSALWDAPSADEERKGIKFAYTLSQALRNGAGDFEFVQATARALGRMAQKSANVDFVESEMTRALEWLRTERSDRRLAACLSLEQFAIHAPTTFYTKTSQSSSYGGSNEFLENIFQALRDSQPVVRACAADALSQCLRILVERRVSSLTSMLCQVHFALMEGLQQDAALRKKPWHAVAQAEAAQHGSLLVVSTMLAYTGDFMLPRYDEICEAVLAFRDSDKALIRLEVVRLIPRLARRSAYDFGRRYLEKAVDCLIESVSNIPASGVGVDIRPCAFTALGQLVLAMTDERTGHLIGGTNLPTLAITRDPENPHKPIVSLQRKGITHEKLREIFALVREGLGKNSEPAMAVAAPTLSGPLSPNKLSQTALHCATDLIEALKDKALEYMEDLIEKMFQAGLSKDLIHCLHLIADFIPSQKQKIDNRMLEEVALCLAGTRDVYKPLADFRTRSSSWTGTSSKKEETPLGIRINLNEDRASVRSIVLSLQTVASFGGNLSRAGKKSSMVPLLPFIQDVVARYLVHPNSKVRQGSVITCCKLLIVNNNGAEEKKRSSVQSYSGMIVEDVLEKLLRAGVSDTFSLVRLCVVRSLDARYDVFLSQAHHLQRVAMLLQDETLAVKSAALHLLGRLAVINPALVLPFLRKFLQDLARELRCSLDTGRSREEATRLLVALLRGKSLRRLVNPMLPSLISALPLDPSCSPRLASASLEALGELALATGEALKVYLPETVPHILTIMQDQSSTSKQRTSLRTLGQIVGSTGYVIQPYFDYPMLLSQATDILPATKRAPWALRREVIRTLGILGALDPDRYSLVATKNRKRGAVGGAYFEEIDTGEESQEAGVSPVMSMNPAREIHIRGSQKRSSLQSFTVKDGEDEELPAYLYMYEQYSTAAVPVSKLPPAKRMTPAHEEFFPSVAIQALMRIFREPTLAMHHGMVIQAVMFIFKSMGVSCVPFLDKVVPLMILKVRNGQSSLRESILKQLSTLSLIVREHLRPYVADIFELAQEFWDSRHMATIVDLVSNIATGVPDEFQKFAPELIQRMFFTLDQQVVYWTGQTSRNRQTARNSDHSNKLRLTLSLMNNLRSILSGYLHILVPSLLKLFDSLAGIMANEDSTAQEVALIELAVVALRTLSSLLDTLVTPTDDLVASVYLEERYLSPRSSQNLLPSRVVQPLVRILLERPPRSPTVGIVIIDTLCVCARQIGGETWIKLYDSVVRAAITSWQSTFPMTTPNESIAVSLKNDSRIKECLQRYDAFVDDMLLPAPLRHQSVQRESVPEGRFHSQTVMGLALYGMPSDGNAVDLSDFGFGKPSSGPVITSSVNNVSLKQRVNQASLQRAWDVSQRSSRDDWEEWMRRFAIRLLQEAPSPALRATAGLAQVYQPLARELFSAAFACCWKDLSDAYRANLVNALETAFVADVSAEILQSLLNLAEFMEHDPDGGLPIDIRILADLALKCRAYAKALHYKEREYSESRSNGCVEALISINRKLDLQDAALGVLRASSLGENISGDTKVVEELSTKFARHHALDMCYSVVWDAQEQIRLQESSHDLSARQELWLAKLGSWTEALSVYQEKLQNDPHDFEAVLGCMRCFDASGEWRQVLSLADDNWQALLEPSSTLGSDWPKVSSRSQRKATRLAAEASWRLGRWDDLEKYSTHLLSGSKAENVDAGTTDIPAAADIGKAPFDFDGAFYAAVLHIHRKEWPPAAEAIDAARRAMDGRMTALLAESYSRAYPSMVTAQMLAEMEEIIAVRQAEERPKTQSVGNDNGSVGDGKKERQHLLRVWKKRLEGCRVDAGVHASVLGVRSLILGPEDDIDATLMLSELSRQDQRYKFAERVLLDPLLALNSDISGPVFGMGTSHQPGLEVDFGRVAQNPTSLSNYIGKVLNGDLTTIVPTKTAEHERLGEAIISSAGGLDRLITQHRLYFAYTKHLWHTDRKPEAILRLSHLCDVIDLISAYKGHNRNPLRIACFLELAEWKLLIPAATPQSGQQRIMGEVDAEVLTILKRTTLVPGCGYRAWHAWALLNFRIAQRSDSAIKNHGDERNENSLSLVKRPDTKLLRSHVVAAVNGFVRAICVGTKMWSASVQQDLLNLLSCLFKFGSKYDIAGAVTESIGGIAIEAWLGVLPQLLARIHIRDPSVRSVLHPLLTRVGEKHPQALMYPLAVLVKSPVIERKLAAENLMTSLKSHSSELVEEALLVSSELIRVAILWLETWHEGLEDASRLWFGDQNVAGMLELLLPLHEKLEQGAETKREMDFLQSFGQELGQAHIHVKDYVRIATSGGNAIPRGSMSKSGSSRMTRQMEEAETAMNKAWDLYYIVFRRINKQLPSLTKLALAQCSPALSRARGLELGVPGSYRVDGSYVKINKFVPSVQVITSKQRPRKITIRGNDGKDYMFLLKGHEDLRQDERVMQLFGLVNALLARDPQTKKHELSIQRYAISPLSHNCGLVSWVPHCDTFHSLIRDYRNNKKVPLNMENREMLKLAPDYDLLTVMQKVEVFSEALRRTSGQGKDLYDILWLKSTNSEEWLDRRTKFTRSLAVMSMVGYILGLGDRHPSNLMLDKVSGRVLHIDFGDCFEVAMNRDKFPEKVPFRLTRMLIKAMEVAGIEGSYRSTCERTMTVLRDSRDSLVAMLEAFVYDPLISWRLADFSEQDAPDDVAGAVGPPERHGVGEEVTVNRLEQVLEDHMANDNNEDDGDDDIQSGGLVVQRQESRARSLQMFRNIQAMAANLPSDDRIQSISGEQQQHGTATSSVARMASSSNRSRMSFRQREVLSLANGPDHEVAVNEKALRVIQRVEEKLTGTDFDNDIPLDVPDQVQRLVVQATSAETLCQLYIGWCAFW